MQLKRARATVRNTMLQRMAAFGGVVLLGGAAVLAVCNQGSHDRATAQPSATPPRSAEPVQATAEPIDLDSVFETMKANIFRALSRYREVNDATRELYDFAQSSAVFSLVTGIDPDGNFISIQQTPDNPPEHAFNFILVPRAFSHAVKVVSFSPKYNTFTSPEIFDDEKWYAIVAYHELKHAWDVHVKKVNYEDADTHTDGEIAAHDLDCELIKHEWPKEYPAFLREVESAQADGRYSEMFDPLLQKHFPLGAKLSSPHFEKAQGTVKGGLEVCFAFDKARRQGKDLRKVYRELTGRLK